MHTQELNCVYIMHAVVKLTNLSHFNFLLLQSFTPKEKIMEEIFFFFYVCKHVNIHTNSCSVCEV